ncbi:MAG: DUF3047 domain-containing protein [Candidatus Omnitrophica bacterium]|nr:DUF3047 domain-containing protein [Candidatus Omnitrophota bacterium]
MKKIFFVKLILWILFFVILVIAPFAVIKNRYITVDLFRKGRFDIKDVIKYFPFSAANSLREWEEKVLKGRVVYTIEKGDQLSYVRAVSQKTASALYCKVKLDINKRPVIRWKWRVDKFPERKLPESIESKKEEDFAARVYVMMPAAFFTKSKAIEYIWSETLEKGTSGQSGYSKNIKVLVLEKGTSDDWQFEKRDIYEDFVKLFGEKPRLKIGAIAFMTDADSTETSADAVYDEIKIGYE